MFALLCEKLEVSPSYLLSEALPNSKVQEMDLILEIWNRATPSQLKIINAMIQSVLDCLDKE